MLRRNLVLVALAIPATAVSATLLTAIDMGASGDAPSNPKVDIQPFADESISRATDAVATNRPSPAIAPLAPIEISEPSLPPAPSGARRRAEIVAPQISATANNDDAVAVARATVSVSVSAPKIAPPIGRRAPLTLSTTRHKSTAARSTSSPSMLGHVGSMQRSNAPASPAPAAPNASDATRGGGIKAADLAAEFMEDCWLPAEFEPPPLSVAFGETIIGQPVALALSLINDNAQPDVFACSVSIHAIGDEGESLGEVRPASNVMVAVDGDATVTQSLAPLEPADLLPWLSQTQFFNVIASGVGQASGDEYASDNFLYVPGPSFTVTLTPDTDVEAGDWVRVTIESDGPLGIALADVQLRLNGGAQLLQPGQTLFEDGTASDVIISLGDLAADSSFSHDEWFIAADPAWAMMWVQLESQQILPQFNCAELWDDSWWIEPPDDGGDGDGSDSEPGDEGDDDSGDDEGDGE